MAKKKSNDIRIRLTRSERARLNAKAAEDQTRRTPAAVAKSILLRAVRETKNGGEVGKRTHPKESARTVEKTAPPQSRGQLSDVSMKVNQELWTTLNDSCHESDRGHILICHAMLDGSLQGLLESYFTLHGARPETIKWLLTKRPMPPLGSFYIRATVAYACGLIASWTYDTLCALNELRNKAAHSSERFKFVESTVSSIVAQIQPTRDADVLHIRARYAVDNYGKHFSNYPTYSRALFETLFLYLHSTVEGNERTVRQSLKSG